MITLLQTAEHLSKGLTTPDELIESALAAANHSAHVFITVLQQRALDDAKASTRRWQQGAPLSPFDGIPYAVKDLLDVFGSRTTAGSITRVDAPMAVEDARRAAAIGVDAIMISNHGGRQLDGSRAPFDQLAEIVDAVGDKIDVILDGGVRRGSHVLKALSVGAKAVSGGRLYLYALAAAGEAGVDRIVGKLHDEIERGMKLMGARSVSDLTRENLRWR